MGKLGARGQEPAHGSLLPDLGQHIVECPYVSES